VGGFFRGIVDIGVRDRVGAIDLKNFGGWGPGESCVARI